MRNVILAVSLFLFVLIKPISLSADDRQAYLIIPYIELSEDEKDNFLRNILPLLTLEGKLINTGTRKAPWYCIEYENSAQAQSEKKNIGAVFEEYQIEFKTQISDTCAAG